MRVGVVVIGRNEANALSRCLQTALPFAPAVVYADSASTDDSPAIAEGMGVAVVRVTGYPMSAARGRNEGGGLLRERFP